MLQQLVGTAALKHGLELASKADRVHNQDQREPEHISLDSNDVLWASQVMV